VLAAALSKSLREIDRLSNTALMVVLGNYSPPSPDPCSQAFSPCPQGHRKQGRDVESEYPLPWDTPGTGVASGLSTERVAGLIYGADLVGACLGAFLSSALLIPVLGIPQTCYAVALLSLAGVLLLV